MKSYLNKTVSHFSYLYNRHRNIEIIIMLGMQKAIACNCFYNNI